MGGGRAGGRMRLRLRSDGVTGVSPSPSPSLLWPADLRGFLPPGVDDVYAGAVLARYLCRHRILSENNAPESKNSRHEYVLSE